MTSSSDIGRIEAHREEEDSLLAYESPLLALLFVAPALAACGPSSSSSSTSSTAVHATIKNFVFIPSTIHVTVGQTIEWTNEDAPPHNVTYVSGPEFRSSGTLRTGATFSVKATQKGTIHYYCSIHPWMKATIAVSP
jgi:plastocyanin